MDNYFVKPEFILEKFQFKENFVIPPIKDINAEKVIDIYESIRSFFPSFFCFLGLTSNREDGNRSSDLLERPPLDRSDHDRIC